VRDAALRRDREEALDHERGMPHLGNAASRSREEELVAFQARRALGKDE
jgi:hypothetical protein